MLSTALRGVWIVETLGIKNNIAYRLVYVYFICHPQVTQPKHCAGTVNGILYGLDKRASLCNVEDMPETLKAEYETQAVDVSGQ